MCLAHCPTHILWGNELDSPRGRIYQIKAAFEGQPPSKSLRLHLDRCLTCRACESACPSDVGYATIVEAGRRMADKVDAPRRTIERIKRAFVAHVVVRPRLFGLLLALARPLMFLSPAHERMFAQSARKPRKTASPAGGKGRKFALFPGCVQRSAAPETNSALADLLAAAGIAAETVDSPCCGALDLHLGRHKQALRAMRENVMKVYDRLESGELEGVVMAASGCGLMLKEYGRQFVGDGFESKAKRFAASVRDPAEVLRDEWLVLQPKLERPDERVAFHGPCTLRHGQRMSAGVEDLLARAGYEQIACESREICCGAAGSYFLQYPKTAAELRRRKLETLLAGGPERILSANVGCILHLRAGTSVPVKHWLEAMAERLR